MKTKAEFTGKVGARQMSFMINDDKDLHTAYYVFLKTVNGEEMTVKDVNSPVGMMEAETRYKAIKKGKEVLERITK